MRGGRGGLGVGDGWWVVGVHMLMLQRTLADLVCGVCNMVVFRAQ